MEEQELKEFEEKLDLADSCGLVYTDETDENGEPIFVGNKQSFARYYKEKKELTILSK